MLTLKDDQQILLIANTEILQHIKQGKEWRNIQQFNSI